MDLSPEAQELFRRYGRLGGRERAARMSAADRRTVARLAAMARWIRVRFGDTSFERLGLPGGDIVDAGLGDLAAERATPESLAVSLAAPRLRREGVPVSAPLPDPERRLFELPRGARVTWRTRVTTPTCGGWYPSPTPAGLRASIGTSDAT